MAKENNAVSGSFFQELLRVQPYKRSQGQLTRRVTFGVAVAVVLLAAMSLFRTLDVSSFERFRYPLSALWVAIGVWVSYRAVNVSRFADFLIAVEAELHKVSWPSRMELVRSSMVVLFVIFAMAGVLFLYDVVWRWLFQAIGVINAAG